MADVIDSSSGSGDGDLELRKAHVTDKLQRREEERVADLQKKKDEKASSSAANESLDYFWDSFDKTKIDIKTKLAESEKIEKGKLADHFDTLSGDVKKMHKFLSDSTMFLSPFQVQRAQDVINKLESAIQQKRDEMIPKKKFAFRSKKKTGDKPTVNVERIRQKEIKFAITECSFADIEGKTLMKQAVETNQKDVALSNLVDCTVKIYGAPSTLHMTNLKRCKIFAGPVSTSVFVDDCSECIFVLPCQQLRTHSTINCKFYIHVTSRAIIEDCNAVEFAPYNWHYKDIDEHYQIAGLDRSVNNWDDVDDFNWLASDQHSPNWCTIDESKRVESWEP